jgi:hypothetical protein
MGVIVGVGVLVGVLVGVGVFVGVLVRVDVTVGVLVGVGVMDGVCVCVGNAVAVLVGVGVAVGRSPERGAHPSPINNKATTNKLTFLFMPGSFRCYAFKPTCFSFVIRAVQLPEPQVMVGQSPSREW